MHSRDPEEKLVKRAIYFFFTLSVIFILSIGLTFFCACQSIPKIADDIDSIATDTAIKIEISRETFQKDTDLGISVQVNNKDKQAK
jgi:hypothetical protein